MSGEETPLGFWDGEGAQRRFWPACDYPRTHKHFVEANGIRFWVETEGAGKPLILIHGGPGIDHRVFHPHMSALAQECQLIYYDLRGHYMSSEPPDGQYGLEQDAHDLEALRQALGLGKIAVLGFSYGGAVALKYGALFPENLSHLIICSTPLGMTIEETKRRAAAHPLSQALQQERDPQVRRELFYRLYFRRPLEPEAMRYQELVQSSYDTHKNRRVLKGYETAHFELNETLVNPCLTVPTLLLYGRHDYLVSLERIESLGLQAKLVIFEESSHHPFVDEPESFAHHVRAFLASDK